MTAATTWLMAYGAGHLDNPYYFIMIGLVPVVNAIFDFGSIGLTRWALRSGLKKVGINTIVYSMFDLIAALLIFVMLGCFSIAVFHFVNEVAASVPSSSGVPVIDLDSHPNRNIFHSLASDPERHWWLYVTFLSTLLPTFVHASVAVWAAGPSLLSSSLRTKVKEGFSQAPRTLADECAKVLPIAIWTTFSVVFPILFLAFSLEVLSDHYCTIGIHILNFFVYFFRVLTGDHASVALLNPMDVCL